MIKFTNDLFKKKNKNVDSGEDNDSKVKVKERILKKDEILETFKCFFDENFFKKLTENVKNSIQDRRNGFILNNMGKEETNIGIHNYEIMTLIINFFIYNDNDFNNSIARSGFIEFSLVKFT